MNIIKTQIQSRYGYSVGDWFIHERSKHLYCIESIVQRSDGLTIYHLCNKSLHKQNVYEWYHQEITNVLTPSPAAKVLYAQSQDR